MKSDTLISVIVPVYNVEEYIERCIESIIKQTYNNIEIILIDDGSKDKSNEICDIYAQKDKRIKVIHKENEGVSKARNVGLDIAKGEYIVFIDSDDYVETNYINTLYELSLENNSDITICGVKDENINGNILNESKDTTKKMLKKETLKELLNEEYFNCVCWAKIYKKKIIGNVRFNENMKIAEDFDFLYKIIDNVNIVYLDTTKKLYHYLSRNGSAIRSGFNESWKRGIELNEKIINDVSKEYPDIIDYAIKRYFRVINTSIVNVLTTSNDKIQINYLKNKLLKLKKEIKHNCLITGKQKIILYIFLISPSILKYLYNLNRKLKTIK